MAFQSIGKVENVEAAASAQAAEAAFQAVKGAETASTAGQPQPAKPATASGRPDRYPDVRLKFLVDAQTRDVTVLVLDRTSQRIIRTIPPDEMAQLNEGDLLELFA